MGTHRRAVVAFGFSASLALPTIFSACGGEKNRAEGVGDVASALTSPVEPSAQKGETAGWQLIDTPHEFSGQATVALEDGSVLITGGWLVDPKDFSDRTTDAAYLFQPAKGTWETPPPMQQSRHLHYAARLLDGRVLVTGGEFYERVDGKDWEHELLTASELFDPKANKWLKTAELPWHSFYAPVVRLLDGPVLLLGGEMIEGSENVHTDLVPVYSPEEKEGSWSEGARLPARLDGHTATLLPDGTVFLAGGLGGGKRTTGTFVLMKDVWSTRPSLLEPRAHHTATVLSDGSVLVVGGTEGFEDGSTEIHYPLEEGKPPTKTASISIPRMQHTAALLPDGRVIIVGGWGYNGRLTSTEIYDPKENVWTAGPELHEGRRNHEMVMAAGRLVVVGDYLTKEYGKGTLEILEVGADLGESCSDGSQCLSGSCVDGVCCDSPCDGGCMACTAALKEKGEDGRCDFARPGTNPRSFCVNQGASSCGTTGVCNGSGACAVYPDGTTCGSDRECQGGQCTSIPTACTGQPDGTECGSGMICEAGECVTAPPCWGQADGAACGEGMICDSGQCVTAPPCWGQADGAECGDGMICESGQCVTAPPCWEQADGAECGEGMICDSGQCVTAPLCWEQADGAACGEGMICDSGQCVTAPLCWEQADGAECGEGMICEAGQCVPEPTECTGKPEGTFCAEDDGCAAGLCREGLCVQIHKLDGTRCEGGVCIAGECRPDRTRQRPEPSTGAGSESDGGVPSPGDERDGAASTEGDEEDGGGLCSLSPSRSASSPMATSLALLLGLGLVRRARKHGEPAR